MDTFLLDPILRAFLAEDLEHGDITTEAIFAPEDQAQACFIARHPMVVVGMATVAARVFRPARPDRFLHRGHGRRQPRRDRV